jgi:hypothetical protein
MLFTYATDWIPVIPKEEVLRVQEVAFVDVASFPSLPTAINKVPLCVRSLILLDPKGEVC